MARQTELERAMARFTTDLVDLIRIAVTQAIVQAAPQGRGRAAALAPAEEAPRRRGRRAAAERGDTNLEERIVRTLTAANGSLSAAEIQERLRAEAGPVRYAIKKLKADGRLLQEGERRGARYRLGGQ